MNNAPNSITLDLPEESKVQKTETSETKDQLNSEKWDELLQTETFVKHVRIESPRISEHSHESSDKEYYYES